MATGWVKKSGEYDLSTGAAAGVPPGDYLVSVRAREIVPPTTPGGYPGSKSLTSSRYESTTTSRLRFTVKPGSNRIDLQLRSDSGG